MALVLTRDQVRAVDRLAIERYGIPGLILMENAGRNAASVIDERFGPAGKAVVVCGAGNNGGDGCVIARHLHNRGWGVRVAVVGRAESLTSDMKVNLQIARAMNLVNVDVSTDPATIFERLGGIMHDEVVVDALLGTGFQGQVRAPLSEVIDVINSTAHRAVVAVDVPSGLDVDTGLPAAATVRADLTVTFVALKIGFRSASAAPFLGEVVVVEIGAPAGLAEEIASGIG